mgnify:CR=1 FL=1
MGKAFILQESSRFSKVSLFSAKIVMKDMEIYYNYVTKHQGINNKTPQEEAIPTLDLGVNNSISEMNF